MPNVTRKSGIVATSLFYLCLAVAGAFVFWSTDQETDLFRKGLKLAQQQDYSGAINIWRPLAKAGHPASQFNLGVINERGLGVIRNMEKAAHWYRKAAEKGQVPAQVNLGLMLLRGRGTGKDPAEAATWLKRAAEKGHPDAQTNLGNLYLMGLGVSKDQALAAKWYRAAARQNHGLAQQNLARQLMTNEASQEQLEEAYGWAYLSAKPSSPHQPSSKHLLSKIAVKLDPAALQRAIIESRNLLKSPR